MIFVGTYLVGVARPSSIIGRDSLVQRIACSDRVTKKGLLYELAVAELFAAGGCTVRVGDAAEKFDVLTDFYCIECKNIDMPPHCSTGVLQKRLLRQQEEARLKNKKFIVLFKRRIPEHFAEWMKRNQIRFLRCSGACIDAIKRRIASRA